jgi:hypothetical protein
MDDANLVEKLDLKHSCFGKWRNFRMGEWENVLSCLFYRIWENRNMFKKLTLCPLQITSSAIGFQRRNNG